jgi:hypothetical protein
MAVAMGPVRRRFRTFAIAAFVVLIPVAVWTAWDYAEARRFQRLVEEIRARNEPLVTSPYVAPSDPAERNAARYYAAASSLVFSTIVGQQRDLPRALAAGGSEAEQARAALRAWLERHREAEALLATATELEFLGSETPLGTNFGPIARLDRLADMRRLERLEAGDGEGAAQAFRQQVKVGRMGAGTQLAVPTLHHVTRPTGDIPRLLALAPPTPLLGALSDALAEHDRDEVVVEALFVLRTWIVEGIWNVNRHWFSTARDAPPMIARPLAANRTRRDTGMMGDLIAQARRPWPEPLHVEGPERQPAPRWLGRLRSMESEVRYLHRNTTRQLASALAGIRVARTAIALELHRRETGALPGRLDALVPRRFHTLPVDPFSGSPLVYRLTDDGFIIYSLGLNQQDDGGNLERPARSPRGAMDPPLDIGLRVSIR